ncbi:methyltransferase [Aestuariivirga sp.]|uniref:class I SAM-dependent methyltransferase n=1 Tax=Aestuariivirga sp. TaxID=2650926 RepID=UPI003593329C
MPPPLVPEVLLHLAHEAVPLWQKTEEELGEMGLPPPFWAFAWAGGQALARYLLDHPDIVRGKSVVDIASGSGLVAIAAMKAGARSVLAADIDGFSVVAMEINAGLNQIFPPPCGEGQGWGSANSIASHPPPSIPPHEGEGGFSVTSNDLLARSPPAAEVILVGDLFYEKELAGRCFDWLQQAEAQGSAVLIGDPGRSYLPRGKLEKLAEYAVPVTRDLEDSEIKQSAVWRLIRNC